jgi:TonB family protein
MLAALLMMTMPVSAEPMPLATPSATARVAKKVALEYPPAARQLNITGSQDVPITVDEHGNVTDAKVLKGNAMSSAASLNAVKQWKFNPLMVEGQAKSFTTTIVFNYIK